MLPHLQKRYIFLTVVVIAVIVTFFLIYRDNAVVSIKEDKQLLLPRSINSKLNNLSKIVLTKLNKSATIIKDDFQWRIAEKNNYLVDPYKLREAILLFSKSELLEKRTNDLKRLPKLGLDKNSALVIQFYLNKEAEAANTLFIGNRMHHLDGTYVRKLDADNKQHSWVSSGDLILNTDPDYWLHKNFFQLKSERIQKVVLHYAVGSKIILVKASRQDKNYTVKGIKNKTLPPQKIKNLIATLGNIDLKDVQLFNKNTVLGKKETTINIYTFDGLRINMQYFKHKAKHFMRLKAFVTDHTQAPADKNNQASAAHKNIDNKASINAASMSNQKWFAWLYEINASTAQGLESIIN